LFTFEKGLRALVTVDSTRGPRHPWLLICYATVLAILSLQSKRSWIVSHSSPLHGLFHVLAFGTLCILATREVSDRRWGLWIAFACFLFGLGIETAQHLVGRHQMEWNDVVDDGIGIGLAGWFIRVVRSALIERPLLKKSKFSNSE
jgi:VanZ family protein